MKGKKAIDALINGFEKRLEHRKANPTTKSAEYFYETMIEYYQKMARAIEEKNPIAWIGALCPSELFYAMDIVPYFLELHAFLVSSQGNLQHFLDASAGYGLPVEVCSAHRTSTGMAIANAAPIPDVLVCTSHVCDSGHKSVESMAHFFKRPYFILDHPYEYNQGGIEYYSKEMEDLIAFLEEHTGRKLDMSRLKEVLELSCQTQHIMKEISEMRKARPTPLRGRDIFRNFTIYMMTSGLPEALKYLEAMRDETKALVNAGKGAIATERFRICWFYVVPGYDMDLFDWMEHEYGATIVMDMMNYLADEYIDPNKPMESLAKKGFYNLACRLYTGPIENATRNFVKMAQDYEADAAVFFAHIGCKQGCSVIRSTKDAMAEDLGIPLLVVDMDCFDSSVTPPTALRNKLEEFFERLA